MIKKDMNGNHFVSGIETNIIGLQSTATRMRVDAYNAYLGSNL